MIFIRVKSKTAQLFGEAINSFYYQRAAFLLLLVWVKILILGNCISTFWRIDFSMCKWDSVARCWNKKGCPKLSKSGHSSYYLKVMLFKSALKVALHLGSFWNKIGRTRTFKNRPIWSHWMGPFLTREKQVESLLEKLFLSFWICFIFLTRISEKFWAVLETMESFGRPVPT